MLNKGVGMLGMRLVDDEVKRGSRWDGSLSRVMCYPPMFRPTVTFPALVRAMRRESQRGNALVN